METRKELNRKINQLYRQLGKVVYEENKDSKLLKSHKKLVTQINQQINQIKLLQEQDIVDEELNIEETKTIKQLLPKDAIVLKPEVNQDGIFVYRFCSSCKTGNNPKSTHCIKCNKLLR